MTNKYRRADTKKFPPQFFREDWGGQIESKEKGHENFGISTKSK